MEIKTTKVPQKGDYYAFQALVWHDGKLQFTLTVKLTRTEYSIALNRNCIKDLDEALQKLKDFTISEAQKIYNDSRYKEGGEYTGTFSPCW